MPVSSRKIRLVSTARHIYDGRSLSPNDDFEATPQDAEDLIALHFAIVAAPIDGTLHVSNTYRRRDMKADK